MSARRGVVVGAGIGGLAAALSLHEVGAEVELFDAVPEMRPLGVGINLLPHAVRELDALGLLGQLAQQAVAPALLLYCTRRGQEIWREPRGLDAGYPWPQLSIHRGALQDVLLGAVRDRLGPGALHLGRRLARLEERGDRAVAVFEDGERSEADLVVAADGIHSAARASRYPDEGPLKWNGSLLWRGVAEIDRVLDGRTMIWAGHPEQKFVGYPIADLPDGRQAFNFIAELRRPGSDLAAWEDWNRAGSLEDFLPAFADWHFGWLDVPSIVRAVARDLPLSHGRPRPHPPLDLRPHHPAGRRRAPDVPDRLQRRVAGHPRRPGPGRLRAPPRRRPRHGSGPLRGGARPGHRRQSSRPTGASGRSCRCSWWNSGRRTASTTSPR